MKTFELRADQYPHINLNLEDIVNPNLFHDAISRMRAIQKMEEEEYTLDDIIMLSRYTYNYCEDTLLTDKDYDMILRYPEYNHYTQILYEDDDYSDYIDFIKSSGFRFTSLNTGFQEEENPIPKERKEELIGKFAANTSMMTTVDKSEVRNMYIAPYSNNINVTRPIEYSSEQEILDNNFKLYSETETPRYINKNMDLMLMSYKHDGWNITAYYIPEQTKVAYAHTRGRDNAKVRDCTFLMQSILPEMEVTEDTKVVMELVINKESMDFLREKYIDRSWVNSRNSVSTFIAGHVEPEDYSHLGYRCFNIINSQTADLTTYERFLLLQQKGFIIPKSLIGGIDYFEENIDKMEHDYVLNYSKSWECDGLVMAIDFIEWTEFNDKLYYRYTGTGLAAYKGGTWGAEIIEAVVEEVYLGRSQKYYTPKARLKPVQSRSGSMIRNVSLLNLDLVKRFWIMPGDVIKVKYHSQQIVLFVDKVSGLDRKTYLEKYKDELPLYKE